MTSSCLICSVPDGSGDTAPPLTGLRELVKRHGESEGQLRGCNKEQNDQRHSLCLEDLLARLLSVLALDRFVD